MKKIFFFAAVMLAAVSMNAQTTVFSWADNVGKTEVVGTKTNLSYDVKIQTNKTTVTSIAFEASYEKEGVYNYLNIMPESGSFQKGDVVKIEYCYNNTATKVATVGLYASGDELLAESPQGINARLADGISSFNYVLTKDLDTIRVARGESGNTRTCVTKLEVVRGETVQERALHPMLSVAGGVLFEPVKIGLSTTEEGAVIYCRLNETGEYAVYADSIEISEYNKTVVVEAFATREGALNSDTVRAEYTLKHFIARPVFNARATYEFTNIAADQINILSGTNGEKGTYNMDGKDCASINYIHLVNDEGKDSVVIVNITGKEDVTFRYKNSENKNNVMKFAQNFVQCDSKNFEIWIENVHSGDTIVFVTTAKGNTPHFDETYSTAAYLEPYMPDDEDDPCFTNGLVPTTPDAKVDNNYSGWTDLVYIVADGGHSKVRIKELDNGFRLAKILVGAYRGELQAVENVNATVKAIKRIENGQLVIIKNGVRYNALGTQL